MSRYLVVTLAPERVKFLRGNNFDDISSLSSHLTLAFLGIYVVTVQVNVAQKQKVSFLAEIRSDNKLRMCCAWY
jgi:hypothetical protein